MSDHATHRRDHAAPLPIVLALTFVCSVGTAALNSGVFFLAEARFNFDMKSNFALAVLFAIVYIPSAALIGPTLRRAIARLPWLTTRDVLCFTLAAIGVLAGLPLLADAIGPWAVWPSWSLWVTVAGYGILTGNLWPMVESYLSGGRKARALRVAIGRFNITWSGALVIAFWVMAPLVHPRTMHVIAGVGVLHLLVLMLAVRLPRDPAGHSDDDGHAHPPVYVRLLVVAQLLLPMSYLVIGAVQPLMPRLCAHVGAAKGWETPLASIWLIARLGTFAIMERWDAWHGKWWLPTVATVLLLLGAGLAVTSMLMPTGPASMAWLSVGLAAFGAGTGAIYAQALYYAMEVGRAEVSAGGRHEALIGAGYLVGPAVGLSLAALVSREVIPETSFEPGLLTVVALLCLAIVMLAISKARSMRDAS